MLISPSYETDVIATEAEEQLPTSAKMVDLHAELLALAGGDFSDEGNDRGQILGHYWTHHKTLSDHDGIESSKCNAIAVERRRRMD